MHQSFAAAVATHSIAASIARSTAVLAAPRVVAVLDLVARGLYVLRRPAHAVVARPIGGLRVVRGAATASAS
ncbi:MAG TPA: hypothetical protein VFR14_07465 [Candidatus Limnocylindrales bacterium]|nr:hypothetical protein [Candidatus Limnocylindrales bacterium]